VPARRPRCAPRADRAGVCGSTVDARGRILGVHKPLWTFGGPLMGGAEVSWQWAARGGPVTVSSPVTSTPRSPMSVTSVILPPR